MATKSKPPTRLNDEQLVSLMALAKDSDSVELKLTLPEEAHRSVINALGLDPLEAEIRQVFFFRRVVQDKERIHWREDTPTMPESAS